MSAGTALIISHIIAESLPLAHCIERYVTAPFEILPDGYRGVGQTVGVYPVAQSLIAQAKLVEWTSRHIRGRAQKFSTERWP